MHTADIWICWFGHFAVVKTSGLQKGDINASFPAFLDFLMELPNSSAVEIVFEETHFSWIIFFTVNGNLLKIILSIQFYIPLAMLALSSNVFLFFESSFLPGHFKSLVILLMKITKNYCFNQVQQQCLFSILQINDIKFFTSSAMVASSSWQVDTGNPPILANPLDKLLNIISKDDFSAQNGTICKQDKFHQLNRQAS